VLCFSTIATWRIIFAARRLHRHHLTLNIAAAAPALTIDRSTTAPATDDGDVSDDYDGD